MNCESIIKTGKNTGRVCNRTSCKIKGHTGCNLAKQLDLPFYYINVYNQNREYFDNLNYLDMYKKHSIIDKNNANMIKDIKKLGLECAAVEGTDKKSFLMILVFKLCDTVNMNQHINNHKRLQNDIYLKIKYYSEISTNIRPEFSQYLKNNFETNKKYLQIKLNKSYRKKIIKKYIRSTMIFYGLYRIVIEKRYRPGGIGYYECEERFYKNCKEFEKLKIKNKIYLSVIQKNIL